jgi:hypothetical protein
MPVCCFAPDVHLFDAESLVADEAYPTDPSSSLADSRPIRTSTRCLARLRSRRLGDGPDRPAWADSGPTGIASGRNGARAKAAVPLRAPQSAFWRRLSGTDKTGGRTGPRRAARRKALLHAAYLNRRYPVGSAGRSELKPASAITETRLTTTTNTKAVAAIVVIGPWTLLSLSHVDAMRKTALAAI